jgi:hypothetical protein
MVYVEDLDGYLQKGKAIERCAADLNYIYNSSFKKKRLLVLFNKVDYGLLVRLGGDLKEKLDKIKSDLNDLVYQRGIGIDKMVGNSYLLYSYTLYNSASILTQINEMLYLQSQNVKKLDNEEYDRLVSLYEKSEKTRNSLNNDVFSLTQILSDKIKDAEKA